MGGVGVAVAILGGLVAVFTGMARSDWTAIGLGLGVIGLALAVGDGFFGTPMWRASEPEPPEATHQAEPDELVEDGRDPRP